MEIKAAAEAGLEQIEVIQSKMAELEKLADKFTDLGNKTPEEKLKLAQGWRQTYRICLRL
jgi:hypothetical protein